jgi:hypothetical protein
VQKFAPYNRDSFVVHQKIRNGYAIPVKDFYKN